MRRRTRAVLPFLVLLTLVGGTLIVHAVEQPDPADPAYLSPVSTADIGAATLAGMLRERGVEVERRTTTAEALAAAQDGDTPATVFIPAPGYAHLDTLTSSTDVPAGTRLVVVGADGQILQSRGWPGEVRRTRWVAAPADPACAEPVAAGRAAVLRHEYTTEDGTLCYGGGVLRFTQDGYQVTLAGAADPFRNDRIGEHRNASLAVALLTENRRVVWLDLHARDVPPPPPVAPEPATTEPTRDPWASPGPEAPGAPGDGGDLRPDERDDLPTPAPAREQPAEDAGQSLRNSPLAQAFPPAFWATALLILLVALAFAAAAARRLGSPVTEPLPSRVPAHETMVGHGRLYQRARARSRSLAILREAARRRITGHLGLPAEAGTDRIAASAGLPAEYVQHVLEGGKPRFDRDLVAAARSLTDLEDAVIHRPVEGENP